MPRFPIFVFCMLIAITGCTPSSTPKGPIAKSKNTNQSQDTTPLDKEEFRSETMLLEDGSTLRYSVYLPKGYVAGKSYPLILSLHYGGKVTAFYGGTMIDVLVKPGLAELEPIIVAPDSVGGGWNSEKNKSAVGELLDYVHQNYEIDEEKTALVGFSMGGHGTWSIAVEYPDRFKCAIPMAARGLTDEEVREAEWKFPFYAIHSKADTVVPIGPSRDFVERIRKDGADVTFVEVDDLPHFKTYLFAKPLSEAIPWIKKQWGE